MITRGSPTVSKALQPGTFWAIQPVWKKNQSLRAFFSTFGAEVPVVAGSLPFVLLLQSQKFGSTTCKNDSKTSEVERKFWKTSTRANPEPRKVLASQLKLSRQKSRRDFFSILWWTRKKTHFSSRTLLSSIGVSQVTNGQRYWLCCSKRPTGKLLSVHEKYGSLIKMAIDYFDKWENLNHATENLRFFFQMASSVGFEKPDSLGLVLNQESGSKKTKINPAMCRQKLKLLKKWSRNWFLFPLFLKAFSLCRLSQRFVGVHRLWRNQLPGKRVAKNEDSNLSFLFQSLNCYHGWNLIKPVCYFLQMFELVHFSKILPIAKKIWANPLCPAKIIFVLTWRSY